MGFRFVLLFQGCLVLFDQIFKYLSLKGYLALYSDFLIIEVRKNAGIAMGTQIGSPEVMNAFLILLFSILVILEFFWIFYLFKSKTFLLLNNLIILMMSGVTGNVLDKLTRGFVVDSINVKYFFLSNLFFNIADLYLLTGALGIFIFLFTKSSLLYFEANKRVLLVVEEEFQMTTSKLLIAIVWSVSFVSFFLTGAVLLYFGVFNRNDILLVILMIQIPFTLLLSFAAYYLGLLFSHRTSGPLFALKRQLIGNSEKEIKLRDDDFHQNYISEIYELIKNKK